MRCLQQLLLYSLMSTDACEGIREHPRPTCIAVRPHHSCVIADHHTCTCTAFTVIAYGVRTDVFVSAERSSGGRLNTVESFGTVLERVGPEAASLTRIIHTFTLSG